MKKVAWVKGPGICEWESEIYEKINKENEFNVTGVCSLDNSYPLNHIKLPIKKLRRYKQLNRIPLVSQIIQYFNPINNKFFNFDSETRSFDVLHACENFSAFSYQCVASGKPTVVTVWENIPFIHESRGYKKFKRTVNKRASHFIAVSEQTKKMLLLEGVPEEKITVIFPGINIEKFRPTKKDDELVKKYHLQGKKVILSIGSLVYGNKGTKDLIYALKLMQNRDVVLLISGKGRLDKKIKNLAKRLGLERNVIFTGSVPYSSIEKLYSVCDIFALPSFPLLSWDKTLLRDKFFELFFPIQFYGWQEQFGYVFAEAMACGKPIVSTFCGAIPEVVKNDETGFLVSPGNSYELAEALKKLLLNKELRLKMGFAGRKLAEEKYDSRKTAKEYSKIYQKVLD